MRSMKGRRYDKRDIRVTYLDTDVFNDEIKPKE